MDRLRSARRDDFKIVTLPALFSATDCDPGRLGQALDDLVDAAEAAIAEGATLLVASDRDVSPVVPRFPACWQPPPCIRACCLSSVLPDGSFRCCNTAA